MYAGKQPVTVVASFLLFHPANRYPLANGALSLWSPLCSGLFHVPISGLSWGVLLQMTKGGGGALPDCREYSQSPSYPLFCSTPPEILLLASGPEIGAAAAECRRNRISGTTTESFAKAIILFFFPLSCCSDFFLFFYFLFLFFFLPSGCRAGPGRI